MLHFTLWGPLCWQLPHHGSDQSHTSHSHNQQVTQLGLVLMAQSGEVLGSIPHHVFVNKKFNNELFYWDPNYETACTICLSFHAIIRLSEKSQ